MVRSTNRGKDTAILEVRGLHKAFGGVTVIEALDLRVEAGEVVALVGANGVGKTTTLRCLVGLETPDAGTVHLNGEPLDERRTEVRRCLCALLDDHAWFPDMTVAEHLAVYARAFGQEPSIVVDALEALGIAHIGDRMPGTLSSGQTQRFRLAQALVRPWDLLMLDEPEQRLDVDGRRWLGGYLRACAAEGCAVLLASHDPTLLDAAGARRVEFDA